MKNKSLLKTNPYLKNPEKRQEIIETFVVSSSAIEGMRSAAEKAFIKPSDVRHLVSVSSSKARR